MGRLIRSGGVTYANSGASTIEAGTPILQGACFGVAAAQIPVGATGWLETTGVWELPKASAGTANKGAAAYWDATNSQVTGTSTSNTLIGVFAEAAVSSATTAVVLLK